MARSHHRKKHKSHLQQFRHTRELTESAEKASGRATIVFAIGGALFGLAVLYFATSGSIPWMIGAAVAGGLAGYLIGKKMDAS